MFTVAVPFLSLYWWQEVSLKSVKSFCRAITMMWLVLQSILFISALRVCSIDNFWSILFCLSNVWSLLHHRSVAESRIKSVIYVLIHFFWHFLLLFIVRFVFCIIFISFLIEVSNFHNKIFKVVSTTFLLVWFSILKESFCETRKNVFYVTSKAVFVLQKFKV